MSLPIPVRVTKNCLTIISYSDKIITVADNGERSGYAGKDIENIL